jgi:hypothetical protein
VSAPRDAEEKRLAGTGTITPLVARSPEDARLHPSLTVQTTAQLARDAEEHRLAGA